MIVFALQFIALTLHVLAIYSHLRRMQRGMESWGESYDGGAERGKVYLTIKLINFFFEGCNLLIPAQEDRKIIVSEREG